MDTEQRMHEMMKPEAKPNTTVITASGHAEDGPLLFQVDEATGEHIYCVGRIRFVAADVATIDDDLQIVILRLPTIVQLIADARAAGHQVTDAHAICVIHGSPTMRLHIWADGTATFNQGRTIHDVAEMRRLLDL